MRYAFALVLLTAIGLTLTAGDPPPPVTPKIKLQPAFEKLEFTRPLWMGHAPGDNTHRWFLIEQAGRIHVFPNDETAAKTRLFLDISNRVSRDHNEEGLLCMAFHPEYQTNRKFYVFYSAKDPRRSILAEYVCTGNPDKADPKSERILLTLEKKSGRHNGCTLLFGPDGYLYVSIGDGGPGGDPGNHGQNLGVLFAKILRIDVDHRDEGLPYAIPPDNPFAGVAGARGEIWAYGLRNVWRMTFDRTTGQLWAGDVGEQSWEEIDLIVKGGNYGWKLREGMHAYEGEVPEGVSLIEPVAEYPADEGISVIGGYVYHGSAMKRFAGHYFYADYITGTMWSLLYENGRVTRSEKILEQPKNIITFAEDTDGELFVTCEDGKIYTLREP